MPNSGIVPRRSLEALETWKTTRGRKPLVVRGARQVGKTTLVRAFSSSYRQFISLNLEKKADRDFFRSFHDARALVDALLLSRNLSVDHLSDTLLFIDEIQESASAISMLRYFYEELPELHVIAAGSLLEQVMSKVKHFPVGRVEYLYLFPMDFQEFLLAQGQNSILKRLQHIPVPPTAHPVLMDWFHRYAITGGMPEVVMHYLLRNSMADLPRVYESIWSTYQEDVEKYARNTTEARIIQHIMSTAPFYLDQRVTFQNFGKSNYRSREVGESFRNLDAAKVIQLIYPTTAIEPPVVPDFRKSPRMQFLDIGLVNHSLGIQAQLMAMEDLNKAYKGALIPQLINQELISRNTRAYHKPHFWVREKSQSSAEVDLVIPYKELLIPVEIKSGPKGSLRSLHQFIDRAPHSFAVRLFAGKFDLVKTQTPEGKPYILMNLPYYLGGLLPEYVQFLVESEGS